MKRVILSTSLLAISLFCMLFFACSLFEDSTSSKADLPVVKAIDATEIRIAAEGTTMVQVTVESQAGNVTYAWTATGGAFADTTTNPATWTAPDEGGQFILECTVTDDNGSRKASTPVVVVKLVAPEGVTAWWPFESDFTDWAGDNDAENEGGVTINTDDAINGFGCAEFPGDETGVLFAGDALGMGPDDDFTFCFWAKIDAGGFLFGKTWEVEFIDDAPGLYLETYGSWGEMGFYRGWSDWWVGEETEIHDGEWHHIAVVHEDGTITIYVDGEEFVSDDFELADDDEMVITMGGGDDGYGWPGFLEGMMDDVRFYDSALSEDDIAAIADE